MECLERPNETIRKRILENFDRIAKPIDGLGRFESWIAQIGAIQKTEQVDLSKKAVVIFCADNGIVEEGISQSGQEVTLAVMKNMARQCSSVGKMAAYVHAETLPVDIGVNTKEKVPGVCNRKIAYGTKNFLKEPAMTKTEMLQAIKVGIKLARTYKEKGYSILAMGEMGIGNTTTSSAIAAALLECDVKDVTGRGAGLTTKKLLHKQQVIQQALEKYELRRKEPLEVLQTVGGLDIAGMVGLCIGGAYYHLPIVLDGVISMVAALVAVRVAPGVVEYLIPSHQGKEPAMEQLARALSVAPAIDGKLALGEGTGAVMMLALLECALRVYESGSTFSEIQMEQYERFQK